jgi:hypothetical protein
MEQNAGARLADHARPQPANPKQKRNKLVFICAGCGQRCWGKPGLSVICARCQARMPSAEAGQ